MSQQKHDKEPWSIFGGSLVSADKKMIGSAYDENARRIVACVNACEGIPIESLEVFNDWAKAGVASAKTYRDQRDELLAALKGLVECPELGFAYTHSYVVNARAAIAKAEGNV
jgi:hypothetical protein